MLHYPRANPAPGENLWSKVTEFNQNRLLFGDLGEKSRIMHVLSEEKRIQVIECLKSGMGLRATSRETGIHRDTIMRLRNALGAENAPDLDPLEANIIAMKLPPKIHRMAMDAIKPPSKEAIAEWGVLFFSV